MPRRRPRATSSSKAKAKAGAQSNVIVNVRTGAGSGGITKPRARPKTPATKTTSAPRPPRKSSSKTGLTDRQLERLKGTIRGTMKKENVKQRADTVYKAGREARAVTKFVIKNELKIQRARKKTKKTAPRTPRASRAPKAPATIIVHAQPKPELRFPTLLARVPRTIPEGNANAHRARGHMEHAIRLRNQLKNTEAPTKSSGTYGIESDQRRNTERLRAAQQELTQLQGKRAQAQQGLSEIKNYLFGTRYLSSIAWRRDIRRLDARIEKTEQTVRALTQASEDLQREYTRILGIESNTRAEQRMNDVKEYAITLRKLTNVTPEIHRTFARRVQTIQTSPQIQKKLAPHDSQLSLRLERIQEGIPTIQGIRKIMLFETYYRMLNRALKRQQDREAAGWLIELSRLPQHE